MTAGPLVAGDPVSCSRVGGAMRRLAGRLVDRCDQIRQLAGELPGEPGLPALIADLGRVRTAAEQLDRAGAALQRYATDLAEAATQARAVERRAESAGLTLHHGRVTEPWGPASSTTAARRREAAPELQAAAERARLLAGTARAALQRAAAAQTRVLAERAGELRGIPASGRSADDVRWPHG